MNEYVHKIPQ